MLSCLKKDFFTLFLFTFFAFVYTFALRAQDEEIPFDKININNGLSQNTPLCFMQDRFGMLWIGTKDGLNLYNGRNFKIYKQNVDEDFSLSDNYIESICEDGQGFIWVGTQVGLNRFDRAAQKFTPYVNDPINPKTVSSNEIKALFTDSKKNLWVGTDNGFCRYDAEKNEFITYDLKCDKCNIVNVIKESADGRIWIGTEGGLVEFDNGLMERKNVFFVNMRIKTITFDKEKNLLAGGADGLFQKMISSNDSNIVINRFWRVADLITDNLGRVWVGMMSDGIRIVNDDFMLPQVCRNIPTDSKTLSSSSISKLFQDDAGIIWVGTEGFGINKYDRLKIKFDVYPRSSEKNTWNNTFIWSICEDKHGKLWIGTRKGLHILDRKNNRVSFNNSLIDYAISCIYEDNFGHIWIGTRGDGLFVYTANDTTLQMQDAFLKKFRNNPDDATTISDNFIRNITQDRRGNVWIGTEANGLCMYLRGEERFTRIQADPNNPNGLSNNKIRGVFADSKGYLWISTYGKGINKYDPATKTFIRYNRTVGDKSTLSSDQAFLVTEDREGNIWIPTFGGGINKLNVKTGKFEHFVEKNGLPNNVVYGVLIDDKGYVWMSTNKGLSRFDPQTSTFRSYTAHDGLQSNEFNYGAYFIAKNGEMFFGGINGVNYFYPDRIKENPYIPKVVFTNFKVANKEVVISDTSVLKQHISVTEEIELFFLERNFTVEFAALHYSLPDNNRYAFLLEGFDTDWTITTANEVKYTNLDEGVYTLKVKGSNSDGVWNETPITLKIVIHPPFYKQKFVILIAVALFLAFVFIFYKVRVRRTERNNRILEQKVRESTHELRKEKEKAEETNELMQEANKKITDSIRYALRIQEAIIPSASEVVQVFGDSFVLFKPRDIVSGDFYWCAEIDDYKFIAVLDCTGHGVPGAFMSVIGFSLLEQIIKVQKIFDPGKILDVMDEDVVHWLRQDKDTMAGTAKRRDGMDMVLVRIDKDNKVCFSGAKNSVFVAHANRVEEYKSEKFSIGGLLLHADKKEFRTFDLPCEKGDCVYLSSDGYFDQFGGEAGRKFTKRRFTDVLLKASTMRGEEQLALLTTTFEEWRGKNNQIDDLLVLGIRI